MIELMSLQWRVRTRILETCTEKKKHKFKSSYQSTSNSVKDKNGDLLVDSYILNRRKKYFSVIEHT
jgi:hypothetical protein